MQNSFIRIGNIYARRGELFEDVHVKRNMKYDCFIRSRGESKVMLFNWEEIKW